MQYLWDDRKVERSYNKSLVGCYVFCVSLVRSSSTRREGEGRGRKTILSCSLRSYRAPFLQLGKKKLPAAATVNEAGWCPQHQEALCLPQSLLRYTSTLATLAELFSDEFVDAGLTQLLGSGYQCQQAIAVWSTIQTALITVALNSR